MNNSGARESARRRGGEAGDVRMEDEDQDDNPQEQQQHQQQPQNTDTNLLPRKRPQAKKSISPVEEMVAFGTAEAGVSVASAKMVADHPNIAAGVWESPYPPKLQLLPCCVQSLTGLEANVGTHTNEDADGDGDEGTLSLQPSLTTGVDALDKIHPKKKEQTPKRRKKRDINVNPRQPQQHQQFDSAISLRSSFSSASSFSSNLFSPTPQRPHTRRMTAAQQQQRLRERNGDDNDGSILFSPRPVESMMNTNRLLPPRPSLSESAKGEPSTDASDAANAAMDMTEPASPLTPSPKSKRRVGGANLSSDTLSSSSSTLPLDKSHSFSPTNNETTSTSTNMTTFRFHSFPESLPRVRPRVDGDVDGVPMSTLRPKHQQQLQMLPPSPATRRLFSTHISGDCSEAGSVQSSTNDRIRKSKPAFKAYAAQEDFELMERSCKKYDSIHDDVADSDTVVMRDDDDANNLLLPQSTTGGKSELLSGTRLNFSSPLPLEGEGGDVDDGKKMRRESRHNVSEIDLRERAMPSPMNYLPTHYLPLDRSHDSLEATLHPHTPRGVLFNAALTMDNLEVSPITRLSEDYDEHEMTVDSVNDEEYSKARSGHAVAETDILDTSTISSPTMIFRKTNITSTSLVNKDTSNSALNYSHGTPDNTILSTTTHRPTAQRKFRPMPDTSAFDVSGGGRGIGGRSINTPSQRSLGSKDSGFHSHKIGGGGGVGGGSITSGGLLCPSTPIRTPAWAHHAIVDSVGSRGNDPILKRANSLISTKVLATTACPPRVLDNLSSLEDSMLENDITGSTTDTSTAEGGAGVGGQETPMLHYNLNHNVLLTLDEKDEHDDFIFRSLEDRNSEDGSSPALPLMSGGQEGSLGSMYSNAAGSVSNRNSTPIEVEEINFSDFDNLGILGSGAFADVYKVRARKGDRRLFAIKRTRRQFRGVKDRERALVEVHTMKRLQSDLLFEATVAASSSLSSRQTDSRKTSAMGQHHSRINYGLYLLFFIRAWQQDGFFYCQTELCSRANCRHLRLSISSEWGRDILRYPSLQLCKLENDTESSSSGEQDNCSSRQDRLIPERAIWQICHDISRGLLHIHSHGMVHGDIKPSNIFFVYNSKWGTICKIGDFGMAGDIGTKDDGQEGDTVYMPNELLSSCEKQPSADIFSLGITLYELAASPVWFIPREGDRWHEIRSEAHSPNLPSSRSENLVKLIRAMTLPDKIERPLADNMLEVVEVKRANASIDSFLSRYVNDVERYDSMREREMESAEEDARRRSSTPIASSFNHSGFGVDTARRVRDKNSDELAHVRETVSPFLTSILSKK